MIEWTNLGVIIETRVYATTRVEVLTTDIPSRAYKQQKDVSNIES